MYSGGGANHKIMANGSCFADVFGEMLLHPSTSYFGIIMTSASPCGPERGGVN
jgi:hypothetical protein